MKTLVKTGNFVAREIYIYEVIIADNKYFVIGKYNKKNKNNKI